MFDTVLQDLEPFAREFVRHGKKVYLVGGAIRNLLLGRPAKDYDFATDARPEEVQKFFRKVLPTGLQHGTVTVMFQGAAYEVTTFRVDGKYTDGRRPDGVTFTPSLEEDLKRRDFTVNAMALNLADGRLIDPHDGRGDLARRVLRAIGEPGQRFDEDALRLLRLFRFASQLGFGIEAATLAAVQPRRPNLALVSRERIREELVKALAGPFPSLAWGPLADLGFLGDLFAGLEPLPLSPPSLERLAALPADLRWSYWLTAACHRELGAWERALKALTFSNADLEAALGPPRALAHLGQPGPVGIQAKAIIEAWGSKSRASPGVEYLTAIEAEGLWKDTGGLKDELARVIREAEPIFVADLAIGGKELLAAGVPPGPGVGRILKALQREVWADPGLNVLRRLLARVPDLR